MVPSRFVIRWIYCIYSLSLSLSVLGRIPGRTLARLPPQIGLIGDTAVLECNTSILVTTSQNFTFRWTTVGGGSLPEKARFTQNNQTLILDNLTLEDNQLYECLVIIDTGEFFSLTYPVNVFGKP